LRFNEAFSQKAEKINEGTRVGKEGIIGKVTLCNFVSAATNQFLEFTSILKGNGEELANE
jgi:hypothetical protein